MKEKARYLSDDDDSADDDNDPNICMTLQKTPVL